MPASRPTRGNASLTAGSPARVPPPALRQSPAAPLPTQSSHASETPVCNPSPPDRSSMPHAHRAPAENRSRPPSASLPPPPGNHHRRVKKDSPPARSPAPPPEYQREN